MIKCVSWSIFAGATSFECTSINGKLLQLELAIYNVANYLAGVFSNFYKWFITEKECKAAKGSGLTQSELMYKVCLEKQS